MLRAFFLALSFVVLVPLAPSSARADDVAEAAQLFERGNEHFQNGMRLRGARRARELESALDDYFASLRLVRSRNVLYNAALVLEQLERWDDAFNYWSEYLAVPGLTDEERTDGSTRRDALRPRVAVARVESTPAGAEVWVDRRDLAARGRTPLEIALPAGEHAIFLVLEGFDDAEGAVTTTVGATASVALTLSARPVMVQVLAPDARLLLDGEEIRAGSSIAVAPGPHVLTLQIDGRPAVERRFEVVPGGAPMVIDLTTAVAALTGGGEEEEATLAVHASRPSRVLVDGVLRGSGLSLELTLAPGEHELALEADGAPAWSGRHTFGAGRRALLTVEAHGTSGGLVAGRTITGVLASLGLAAAVGLSIAAWDTHQGYMVAPSQALFEEINTLNGAADVAWGATCALGIAALVLVIADDAGVSGAVTEEE